MSAHHRTAQWATVTRRVRPRIRAALPLPCVDCGRPVLVGQRFHVGHIVAVSQGGTDDPSNLGPSHVGCNTSSGGRMGAEKTNAKRKRERREGGW